MPNEKTAKKPARKTTKRPPGKPAGKTAHAKPSTRDPHATLNALPAQLSVAAARRIADRLDQVERTLLKTGDLDHPDLRAAREQAAAARDELNAAADRAVLQGVA